MGVRIMKNKNGVTYRAEKKIRGMRHSKNFNSKEAAENWIANLEENFVTKHVGSNDSKKKMSVRQMMVRLVEVETKKDRDPRTIEAYMETLPHFQPILDTCVSDLKPSQLVSCFKGMRNRLNGQMLSRGRLYKFLGRFTRALAIAARKGVFMKDFEDAEAEIVGFIENNGKGPIETMPYLEDELRLLLDYKDTSGTEPWWVPYIIRLYLYTGKRFGEIAALTNDKINHKTMKIYINCMISGRAYHDHLKARGKSHYIVMDQDLSDLIKEIQEYNKIHHPGSEWLFPPAHYRGRPDFKGKHKCPYKGQPILDAAVRKFVWQRMIRSGAGRKKVHDFRSTYATLRLIQLLRDQNPLAREIVQAELNHKHHSTTSKYIKIAEEYLQDSNRQNAITSFLKPIEPKVEQSSSSGFQEMLKEKGIDPDEINWDVFWNLLSSFTQIKKKAA